MYVCVALLYLFIFHLVTLAFGSKHRVLGQQRMHQYPKNSSCRSHIDLVKSMHGTLLAKAIVHSQHQARA